MSEPTAPSVDAPDTPEAIALARPIEAADLAAAIAVGVVDRATATKLAGFVATRPTGRPVESDDADEERVRFVTSFNDVFVVIGILLLGAGTILTLGRISGLAAAAATTVLAWVLSEIFSRRWRMAFPSIVLVAALVVAAGATGGGLVSAAGLDKSIAGIVAGATAFAAGFLHWRRFGVPISVAGAVAGGGFLIQALLSMLMPATMAEHGALVVLVLGLVAFGLAMWWDASDRERRTRRADVAFWLHVLAAPAIVHPLLFTTSGFSFGHVATDRPGIVLAIYAGLAIVALVVDRRALLVSGLLSLGFGTGALIEQTGWAAASAGSVAAGVVGAVVLGLAVAWTPLRNSVVGLLPASVRAVVPPPRLPLGR